MNASENSQEDARSQLYTPLGRNPDNAPPRCDFVKVLFCGLLRIDEVQARPVLICQFKSFRESVGTTQPSRFAVRDSQNIERGDHWCSLSSSNPRGCAQLLRGQKDEAAIGEADIVSLFCACPVNSCFEREADNFAPSKVGSGAQRHPSQSPAVDIQSCRAEKAQHRLSLISREQDERKRYNRSTLESVWTLPAISALPTLGDGCTDIREKAKAWACGDKEIHRRTIRYFE